MSEAYIFETLRTPRGRGRSDGALYEVKPIDLLATLLVELRERCSLELRQVDDVLIGCVTPVVDQGHNIARAAVLHAGWPDGVGGMQLNRYCASGLEAVNLAAMKVRSGWETLVVAGGVESMSRVPIGSDGGPLLYDPEVINARHYIPRGVAADLLATMQGFSRETLDAFALRSQRRAVQAQESGYFSRAMAPIHDRNGLLLLDREENLRPDTSADALAALPPAFAAAGELGFDDLALQRHPHLERIEHVHTAGNSSAIADGAALVLVGNREQALAPRARIVSVANVSVDPTLMFSGHIPAARLALQRAGMTPGDIDLWECHEAFAAVALQFQRELNIDDDHFNVNGGAIALGHPLGATGAILIGALLDELERRDRSTGLVALSGGGGLGVATVIERLA